MLDSEQKIESVLDNFAYIARQRTAADPNRSLKDSEFLRVDSGKHWRSDQHGAMKVVSFKNLQLRGQSQNIRSSEPKSAYLGSELISLDRPIDQ